MTPALIGIFALVALAGVLAVRGWERLIVLGVCAGVAGAVAVMTGGGR